MPGFFEICKATTLISWNFLRRTDQPYILLDPTNATLVRQIVLPSDGFTSAYKQNNTFKVANTNPLDWCEKKPVMQY